ncbi:MAG: hypothetical protein IH610_11710 [Deltaproteobacteria bacterium]|nr:hypothetical protein [Deltaproteobacteria bacterium]
MDKKECAVLISKIDRIIDTLDPQRAEYLRGYHRGLRLHVLGVSDEWTEKHRMLMGHSSGSSGNPCINSYARGYRDGFEGMTPESPFLSSVFSRPLRIDSTVKRIAS